MAACGSSSSRWPAARTCSAISWRVRGPSATAARTAAVASGPMPICSRRRRPRASPTGPSSATSQRASSAGTRCSVPRMHQMRATERSSKRAWSTAEAVAPGSRARTPRAAAGMSWACNPPTRRTTSPTVAAVLPLWTAEPLGAVRSPRARSEGRVRGTAKRSRMTSLQASRTLVKSPPELWAELSELESLARHLGEFGEIRITQVDPESRVEWEADRASGTVRLEPSGWGTRVVLTVDTPEPVEASPSPSPRRSSSSRPRRSRSRSPTAAVSPSRNPSPPRPPKRGWFARLFRRTPPPRARAPARACRGRARAGARARPRARPGAGRAGARVRHDRVGDAGRARRGGARAGADRRR